MEILDIVDDQDNVIGSATRDEIYKKLLPHRIVHILIFNDKNEMALQLRSKHVSFCPLYWCTAAVGHVQTGESYEEGALREYEEELGVASELHMIGKDIYEAPDKPKKFITVYRAIFNGSFTKDERDVEKVEFFPVEKIRQMVKDGEKFHPESLFILKKYFVD